MSPLSHSKIALILGLAAAGVAFLMMAHRHQERKVIEAQERCENRILTALQRDRAYYEAIVRAVEKKGLKPGDRLRFAFPKSKTPDDLRLVEESFDEGQWERFLEENTLIHATQLANGELGVMIVECDLGHAGMYAVYYTSKELTEKEFESLLRGPAKSTRIDPHWWAVVTRY